MKFPAAPRAIRPAFLAALALNAIVGLAGAAPIVREEGAVYLSDFGAPPLKLKVLAPAPSYFDFSGKRYVGTLSSPQVVEVQAISPNAYRVRGNAQQGQVLAWVEPKFLEPVPADTIAALEKADKRRKVVDALIAKNEIAIGMTPTEIESSIGKPQKRTSRASKEKAPEQVWEYVKYVTIPQNTTVTLPNGEVSVVTNYIKKPIGQLTITFKEGAVESLDQSEGTVFTGNETSIVAPPITISW